MRSHLAMLGLGLVLVPGLVAPVGRAAAAAVPPAIAAGAGPSAPAAVAPAAADPAATERAATPALALAIRSLRETIRAGDAIPIEFTITNTGQAEYVYLDRHYDRSGRMPEYRLTARDAEGRPVADPRASWPGGPGGGLAGEGKLAPAQSYAKAIDLNRWALVTRPGRYEVTGVYYPGRRVPAAGEAGGVASLPIAVAVEPRSDVEMADHIARLAARLRAAKDRVAKEETVRHLMYTCDARIVPPLLDSMYDGLGDFWEGEAFIFYLPHDDPTREALMRRGRERGMAMVMPYVFDRYGYTAEDLRPLIEASLAADRPHAWHAGALLAQRFVDDGLMPRLIAIATDPASRAREQAIFAVALHRTDEGVAALKRLLEDPDRRIRERARFAIRVAYTSRGNAGGRPLRPDDFPADLQRAEGP